MTARARSVKKSATLYYIGLQQGNVAQGWVTKRVTQPHCVYDLWNPDLVAVGKWQAVLSHIVDVAKSTFAHATASRAKVPGGEVPCPTLHGVFILPAADEDTCHTRAT